MDKILQENEDMRELLENIRAWMDRNQDKIGENQEVIEIAAEINEILGE